MGNSLEYFEIFCEVFCFYLGYRINFKLQDLSDMVQTFVQSVGI